MILMENIALNLMAHDPHGSEVLALGLTMACPWLCGPDHIHLMILESFISLALIVFVMWTKHIFRNHLESKVATP